MSVIIQKYSASLTVNISIVSIKRYLDQDFSSIKRYLDQDFSSIKRYLDQDFTLIIFQFFFVKKMKF